MKSNKLKEESEPEKQRGTKWQKKEIKREILVRNRKYKKTKKTRPSRERGDEKKEKNGGRK
jgi:hypothetical protein